MTKALFLPLALFAASLAMTTGTASAAQCAETDYVVEQLEKRFGETLEFIGALRNQNTVEIYTNAKSDRWTITVSIPKRGLSCLVSTGSGRHTLNTRLKSIPVS